MTWHCKDTWRTSFPSPGMPETTRDKWKTSGQIFLWALRRNRPCQNLNFGCAAPKTMGPYISLLFKAVSLQHFVRAAEQTGKDSQMLLHTSTRASFQWPAGNREKRAMWKTLDNYKYTQCFMVTDYLVLWNQPIMMSSLTEMHIYAHIYISFQEM